MPRFLTIFGALLGTSGVVTGALFLVVRYGVYMDAVRAQRGPFAPMLWQLSVGTGTLVMTLSALFGFLLFMLGRTLARVERLEAAGRTSAGTSDAAPLLGVTGTEAAEIVHQR